MGNSFSDRPMSETAGVRMDVVAVPPWLDEWTPPWPVAAPAPGEPVVPAGDASPETVEAAFVRFYGSRFEASCPSP